MDGGRPSAILLVGPPGSGKSTWREAYMANDPRDTVVLSTDDLVEAWGAPLGLTYSEAFRTADLRAFEAQMRAAFAAAVAEGKTVLIDRTNMSRKTRRKWLNGLPKSYHRTAVVFEVPEEELRHRLTAREEAMGKHIPERVVSDMLASYEAPTIDEFHEILRP